MKYSEAEKQIKALSSKYDVYMGEETFTVNYKNKLVAWVKTGKRYLFFNDEDRFKQIPFSNKLYMILSELAITPLDKRVDENKYRVKVFGAYLNINVGNNRARINTSYESSAMHTKFTSKEIEQLKQRKDIPLDWNKVTLEEAD